MIDPNKYNKILIIGYPAGGKSTYFEELIAQDRTGHYHLRTDDYMHIDFKEQLYVIMDELEEHDKWIVEGVQGYRLLRKYAELAQINLKPDVIVMLESPMPVLEKHKRMRKSLDKIFMDYLDLERDVPEIVEETWQPLV